MPLIRQLFERATKVAGLQPSSETLADWFGGGVAVSKTGLSVTPENSTRVTTVYACASLVAETIGSLPVDVVRGEGRFRFSDDRHPLARLLTTQPNPEMDSGEFWRQVLAWMLLRGNGYAFIEPGRRGVEALWPLPARQVRPVRLPDGALAYVVWLRRTEHAADFVPETKRLVMASDMLHFRAFGTGLIGLSPIAQAAEAVGLSLAAEEYGARFFTADARPGGAIQVPGTLTDKAFKRMRKQWESLHRGLERSHLLAILEEGAQWQTVGVAPAEAQFLELRQFQVAEICRLFRVPPHMVGDVTRSTSWGSGIESQAIGFITYTLLPWISRLERVVKLRLLPEVDRFLRFRVNGLLRGDLRARAEFYAKGRQWGWLSRNDIRALEDEPPVEGGDDYLVPMNMQPLRDTGSGGNGQRHVKPEGLAAVFRDAEARSRHEADLDALHAQAERLRGELDEARRGRRLVPVRDETGLIVAVQEE